MSDTANTIDATDTTTPKHIRQGELDWAFWVDHCSRLASQLSMRTTTNNPPNYSQARNTLRDMVEAAQSALVALEIAQALKELEQDLNRK